jgi:hypothetical protein
MRTPPLLVAAALLLWGACAGHLLLAAGMAIALEAAQRGGPRWVLGRRDFEIIADLCTLALAGVLSYLFAQTRHFPNSLAIVIVWLPAFYFALLLAQRVSSSGRVPLSALLWSLRSRYAPGPQSGIALDFAYAALCVLAAAGANVRSLWFFAGAAALTLYALWPAGRGRAAKVRWLALGACATSIAFVIQLALSAFQSQVEEVVLEWLTARLEAERDPYRARTAIGDLGRLKLSDRIVLRVRTAPRREARVPLLRTASYQHYAAGGWLARKHAFAALRARGRTWDIADGAGGVVEVAAWLSDGRALLALPAGTYRLDALEVQHAERNRLGALRVAEGADPLFYRAWYDPSAATDAPPDDDDLEVPDALAPTLAGMVEEVGPRGEPGRYVEALQRFFATHFTYSLALTSSDGQTRTLVRFLESDRRGHCEYFATATVLLLRQAGIPARYAVGYAVQEYSPLEGQYIARRRDAHAWALAWLGGRWVDVDATPATWFAEESRDAALLQPVYDLFSWLNYRLAAWRSQDSEGGNGLALLLAASPLLAILLWRLYRQRSLSAAPRVARDVRGTAPSPLQPVLEQLARDGYVRPAHLPLLRWVRELPLADAQTHRLLLEAAALRYRQRFSPGEMPAEQASQLQEVVARLQERLRRR